MNHSSPEDIYLHLVEYDLYPIGSMGLVYLPAFTIKTNHSCIGKYTSPMDPIGMVNVGRYIPVPSIWANDSFPKTKLPSSFAHSEPRQQKQPWPSFFRVCYMSPEKKNQHKGPENAVFGGWCLELLPKGSRLDLPPHSHSSGKWRFSQFPSQK